MSSSNFRSLTIILLILVLGWSSTFETCDARRGKHWRHNRNFPTSLSKKKGKNHVSSHHHSNGNKPKPKTPSPVAPAPPATKPKDDNTPAPPTKDHNYIAASTYHVLDFGAKGDGKTDDTKVTFVLYSPTDIIFLKTCQYNSVRNVKFVLIWCSQTSHSFKCSFNLAST